jgi:hypothetical protein
VSEARERVQLVKYVARSILLPPDELLVPHLNRVPRVTGWLRELLGGPKICEQSV